MEELNKLHGKELEEAELTDEEKKYVNTLLVPPDPNISEEEKEKIRKEIMEKILWFKIDWSDYDNDFLEEIYGPIFEHLAGYYIIVKK